MEEQDEKMESLYERFKKELHEETEPVYHDEQEIIDIFDYAGDVRDDYVRLEAIMLGNRLFPRSVDLLKRRAILLADISNEAFAAFMKDNRVDSSDVMWAIFQCRACAPRGEEAVRALEGILDKFRLSEDEETIQFVNLVRELQQEDWLIRNVETVKKRCDYTPTLLYEIARVAETNSQLEVSIGLLEELTMVDPFNYDYWGLLAELQSATERYDDSLSSLDYAKALTPDDFELYSLEGYVKLKKNDAQGSIIALKKALEINSDCYPAKRNLAEAYKLAGTPQLAAPIIAELFAQDPSDAGLLSDSVILFPDRINESLDAFHRASTETDEVSTLQRVGEMCVNGHTTEALAYLRWYRENRSLTQTGNFAFLELLYVNRLYEEAYLYIMENCTKLVLDANEIPIVAIIASTLLKMRQFDEAKEFTRIWIDKLQEPALTQNAYRLINRGLLESLKDINSLLQTSDEPSDDDIERVVI